MSWPVWTQEAARVSSELASPTLQSASALPQQPFLYRPAPEGPIPLPTLSGGSRVSLPFVSHTTSLSRLPRWPGCTRVCHRRCGCVPTRGNRLSDGFGFGLQSHPAAHISSAAQKSREMGRACDSKLGKCRNIVGSWKELKWRARKKLFIVLSVRLV